MMKSNQQLIDEYLANGGTISVHEVAEDVHEPVHPAKLIPTEFHTYDREGKRIYKYLNKVDLGVSLDETTLNYGK